MDYKILRDAGMKGLAKKVKKYIGLGWVTIGGVSVCGGYGHAHFHQAMIKEEE